MLIPADYAQVNFIFTGVGVPNGAQTTLGLNVELWPGTPQNLADLIATHWADASMDNLYTEDASLTSILVKFGPNATGPAALWSGNQPGFETTDQEAPQVSALVHKNTPFGGRTGKGRMYLPSIPSTYVSNNGVVNSGWISSRNADLESFFDKLVADDVPPALLHSPDSPVAAPILITSLTLDSKVATQRRRIRR